MTSPAGSASTTRLSWMDDARGLAVLLVVLFHGQTVLGRFVPEVPEAIKRANLLFAPFRMPLLMFLSGMLLARSLSKPTGAFFRGKLRAIAWPYLLWSLVFLVVTDLATPARVVKVLYLPPTYLWYLWFLLAYYVIAWVMERIGFPYWLALAGSFLAAWGPDTYRFSRFFYLFLFFAAGHLWTTRYAAVLAPHLQRRAVRLAAAAALVTAALASSARVSVQYEPWWLLGPAAAVVLCLALAPGTERGPVRRVLGFAGKDSIVFYVTHFVVLWVVCWWAREAGLTNAYLVYAAAVGIALATGFTAVRLRRLPLVGALFAFPQVDRAGAAPRPAAAVTT